MTNKPVATCLLPVVQPLADDVIDLSFAVDAADALRGRGGRAAAARGVPPMQTAHAPGWQVVAGPRDACREGRMPLKAACLGESIAAVQRARIAAVCCRWHAPQHSRLRARQQYHNMSHLGTGLLAADKVPKHPLPEEMVLCNCHIAADARHSPAGTQTPFVLKQAGKVSRPRHPRECL